MGGAAPFLMGAGLGLQAYGAYSEAKAQKAEGKEKRKYYNFLATQNEADANQALADADTNITQIQDEGAREAKQLVDNAAQVSGAQRVTLAANGVGGGSATAEDIGRDTLSKENLDEMTIKFNADSKAYAEKKSAQDRAYQFRTNAFFNRLGGENVYQASRTNAQSTLLGGATKVADSWANWLGR